jgi:sorbitol-specific phosphotransferase system component IIA
MPKEKTIQGIGPEVADGLQKVLILFKRRKG